jgi:hypothetical protein
LNCRVTPTANPTYSEPIGDWLKIIANQVYIYSALRNMQKDFRLISSKILARN